MTEDRVFSIARPLCKTSRALAAAVDLSRIIIAGHEYSSRAHARF